MKFTKREALWSRITKQAEDLAREEGVTVTPEHIAAIRGRIVAASTELQEALATLPGDYLEPAEVPPEVEEPVMGKAAVVAGWKIEDAGEEIRRQDPSISPSEARLRAVKEDPALVAAYHEEYLANRR